MAGALYMKEQLGDFGGNMGAALRAYNSGPLNVNVNDLSDISKTGTGDATYVNKVMNFASIISSGGALCPRDNRLPARQARGGSVVRTPLVKVPAPAVQGLDCAFCLMKSCLMKRRWVFLVLPLFSSAMEIVSVAAVTAQPTGPRASPLRPRPVL